MPRTIKIPPLLQSTVVLSMQSINGMLFKNRGPCPHCGGKPIGYDTKEKIFAEMITPNGKRTIYVYVRRYKCKNCGALLYADEPFYPDTRTGSIVVDLAISLAMQNSYSHTAKIMNAIGFNVDRGSVRNFSLSAIPLQEMSIMYGMKVPNTFVTLISKMLIPGSVEPQDIIEACKYPSRYKAPDDLHGTAKEYRNQLKESDNHD